MRRSAFVLVAPVVVAVVAVACSPSDAPETAGSIAITAPGSGATSSLTTQPRADTAATAPATTYPTTTVRATSTTTSTTVSSTSTSTSTSTIAATLPTRSTTISMAFTGDTLAHSPLWRRAARNIEPAVGYDFGPMLSGLRPVIGRADLAICHLETPIAPLGEELSTSPFYGVPEEVVHAIADVGYDRCSTASNHAADRGTAGVDRTVDVLEAAGLDQSGMAREPVEIEPQLFEVDGVAFSHLSYTFSYNGLSFPDDQSWRSAVIDPERIITDAGAARGLGADVVLVSMHWGAEGVHEPTTGQRRVADEITASGLIDLVVGHHAHVVQPIEMVNDTWVVYGLGNILSNLPTSDRWPAASQDAMVVTVDLTVGDDGGTTIARPVAHPTWVDKDAGWEVRLVDVELARDDIGAGQRGRLEQSRARTTDVVGDFVATTVPAG